jgi:flagella basal body P-ring formation protein FlgA
MKKWLASPILFVAFIALVLLSARIMSAQTTPTKRVAIATHAIPRGATLAADDFVVRDTAVRFVGAMPDTTPVSAGWTTRRAYAAGEILRTPGVEAPTAVNANTPVEVEFQDKNVSLTLRGIAARNAAVGERVPVRTETGRRIEATVVAPGRVRID